MGRTLKIALLLVSFTAPFVRAQEGEPNQATLKRLAQQLGTGKSTQIDPELLKWAQEYLKNNPNLQNDPAFQKMKQEMQEKMQKDPEGFVNKLKQDNPGLTPQQLEQFKNSFPKPNTNPNPGQGPGPMPNIGPMPMPNPNQNPNPGPGPGQNPNGQPRPPVDVPKPNPTQPITSPSNIPKTTLPNEPNKENGEGYKQAVGLWEKNVGPIENTPALKKSLADMFSGQGKADGWNGSGMKFDANGNPQKSFWDNGNNGNGSSSPFVNWMKGIGSNGGPSWWKNLKFGGGNTNANLNGNTNWTPPRPPGSFNTGGGGFALGGSAAGLGPVGIALVALVLAAIIGFVVWRYWPQILAMRNKPKPIEGLGDWPIDPRDVIDRDSLVRCFEYISVLICGDGARVWNHLTISEAFRENVPGAAPFAEPLARIYALARYTPLSEPMASRDIEEGRKYLCTLAGVAA